jgi:hypothetical protein
MAKTHNFEPGTIVRFKNLTECQEMNDSYGIVKSKLDNGKLRIRTNTKNDMAVPVKFCDPVKQCLNEPVRNVPCMIWTRSTGETVPRVHWLHEAPKNIFPVSAFAKVHFDFIQDFKRWSERPGELVGDDNAKKTISYLKNTLNWKQPRLKAFLRPQFYIIIWHDNGSTAKPNHVLNTIFNSVNNFGKLKIQNNGEIVKIRGPVMYFEYTKMLQPGSGQTNIISMITLTVAYAEFFKRKLNCSEAEFIQKIRSGEIKNPEYPYDEQFIGRMLDLDIKYTVDSVCKVKNNSECEYCAEWVGDRTNPIWKPYVFEQTRKYSDIYEPNLSAQALGLKVKNYVRENKKTANENR